MVFFTWWNVILVLPFISLDMIPFNSLNVFIVADLNLCLVSPMHGLCQGKFLLFFLFLLWATPLFLYMSHNFLLKNEHFTLYNSSENQIPIAFTFLLSLLFVYLETFLKEFYEVCALCHMWLLKSLLGLLSGHLIFGQRFPSLPLINKSLRLCWGNFSALSGR